MFGCVGRSDPRATSIQEQPLQPKSNWAERALYVYDNGVARIAKASSLRCASNWKIQRLTRPIVSQSLQAVRPKIASPEIALGQGFIKPVDLQGLVTERYAKNEYAAT